MRNDFSYDWVVKHAEMFAGKTFKKLSIHAKNQTTWDDLRGDMLLQFEVIKGTLNFEDNWRGYVSRVMSNLSKTMIQKSYDDDHLNSQAVDLEGETAVEFNADGSFEVVQIDVRDSEFLIDKRSEDERKQELIEELTRKVERYCIMFDIEYDSDNPCECLINLLNFVFRGEGKNKVLKGKVLEDLKWLRRQVQENGIRIGLNKGVIRAEGIMDRIRQLFDEENITTKDEIVSILQKEGKYFNERSVRVLVAKFRAERGLPHDSRKKSDITHMKLEVRKQFLQGVDKQEDILNHLAALNISFIPSTVYRYLMKLKREQKGIEQNEV